MLFPLAALLSQVASSAQATRTVWTIRLAKNVGSDAVLCYSGGLALVVDGEGTIAVDARDGHVAWLWDAGGMSRARAVDAAVVGPFVVVLREAVTEQGSRLTLVSGHRRTDGRPLYARLYDGRPCSRMLAGKGAALVGFLDRKAYALNPGDGDILGAFESQADREGFGRLFPGYRDRLVSLGEQALYNGRRIPLDRAPQGPPTRVTVWQDSLVGEYEYEDFPLDLGDQSGLTGFARLRPADSGWDAATALRDEWGGRFLGRRSNGRIEKLPADPSKKPVAPAYAGEDLQSFLGSILPKIDPANAWRAGEKRIGVLGGALVLYAVEGGTTLSLERTKRA